MVKMNSSTQVGLYIALEGFPDTKQTEESQAVLNLLKEHKIVGKIGVRGLRDLEAFKTTIEHGAYDDYINTPPDIRLPYLICHRGGEMAGAFGYSGIEAITEQLNDLGLLEKV